MKEFKFFRKGLSESNFSDEIISAIYHFCREYICHLAYCKIKHLEEHPEINPNSSYSYHIEYFKQERYFNEGRLWYAGSDLDEDLDKVFHTSFLDISEFEYYCFRVEETEDMTLIMYDITLEEV
jgi:hypothetical protein